LAVNEHRWLHYDNWQDMDYNYEVSQGNRHITTTNDLPLAIQIAHNAINENDSTAVMIHAVKPVYFISRKVTSCDK